MEAELFHADTKRQTYMMELRVAYRNLATSNHYRLLGVTYRSHLEVLTLDNVTKTLYRNVGKELPLYAK